MTKFYYLPAIAIAAASVALPLSAEQLVITVEEAGTLPEVMTAIQKAATTDLKVIGPLNGTDLKLLRWMTGMDEYWKATTGRLVNIDLSEAEMKEGGEAFNTAMGSDPASPIWIYARENTMPEELFDGTNLQSIIFPNSVTAIRSAMAGTTKVTGTVTVPEGVLYVGEWAFAECGMEEIILPSTLTYNKTASGYASLNFEALGSHAFDGCQNLKKIEIPAEVEYLKVGTFANCGSLESLTIPATIRSIGASCFANSAITDLYVEGTSVPVAEYGAFDGVDFDAITIHVEKGMVDKFKAAEYWSEFTRITDGESGVNEIEIAEGNTAVYTIDGKQIDADINDLPSGLYVIDGKKVIK